MMSFRTWLELVVNAVDAQKQTDAEKALGDELSTDIKSKELLKKAVQSGNPQATQSAAIDIATSTDVKTGTAGIDDVAGAVTDLVNKTKNPTNGASGYMKKHMRKKMRKK